MRRWALQGGKRKGELEGLLKGSRARVSGEQKEKALKHVGGLSGKEVRLQQKLHDMEGNGNTALGRAGELRANLDVASKNPSATEKDQKELEGVLSKEDTRAPGKAGVLQEELARAERMVIEQEVQLQYTKQRELELLDELATMKETMAALRKDVHLTDGQKETAAEQLGELVQKVMGPSRGIREVGNEFMLRGLERKLEESNARTIAAEVRLQKFLLKRRVIDSELEHRTRLLEELTVKTNQQVTEIAELQKQLHTLKEVLDTQVSVALVHAEQVLPQVQQQDKQKAPDGKNWLKLGL